MLSSNLDTFLSFFLMLFMMLKQDMCKNSSETSPGSLCSSALFVIALLYVIIAVDELIRRPITKDCERLSFTELCKGLLFIQLH